MIPFTQYLRPDGRKRATEIERPAAIEAMAQAFINAGGRFESEELTNGIVSLTAVYKVEGAEMDIAIALCVNGPAVPHAVDAVVRDAFKFLEKPADAYEH